MNNSNKSSSGMSLAEVLTVIFVILKLCGVINWGWIWVLSPVWIGLIIGLLLIIFLEMKVR